MDERSYKLWLLFSLTLLGVGIFCLGWSLGVIIDHYLL